MDLHQRTLRFGLMAILCAAVFRLCSMDLSGYAAQLLKDPNLSAFLIYLETGRDVRFSPSTEAFSPDFVETPPPATPEPVIPFFNDLALVDIQYASSVQPDPEALLSQPLSWDLYSQEPSVLIIHTHATESYTKNGQSYIETASYRTLDENYNMLSIGAHLAQLLTEQGIRTIHDRTLHDYPSYNGSYLAARNTIQSYLEEYPSIQLVLDLHRDASEGTGGQLRTLAHVEDAASAQLMVVLGTNHESYQENLSLGLKLHAQLETQCAGITRPLQLRSQRFNQDLIPGALLIEVGAAGNTQSEALLAVRQLAKAVTTLARGTLDPEEEKASQK